MTGTSSSEITELLHAWRGGDQLALEKLTPVVYQELHRMARQYMAREREGHTLQTTALIHEAYLRLVKVKEEWQDRAHFFAVSAQIMRRILTDFAPSQGYQKRGGGAQKVSIDDVCVASPEPAIDLVALERALMRLGETDSRKSKVVELRFFGGLTVDETAEVLYVSAVSILCGAQSQEISADKILDAVLDLKKTAKRADELKTDGAMFCSWGRPRIDVSDLDDAISRHLLNHSTQVPDTHPRPTCGSNSPASRSCKAGFRTSHSLRCSRWRSRPAARGLTQKWSLRNCSLCSWLPQPVFRHTNSRNCRK